MTLFWPALHDPERKEQARDLEEWVGWLRSVDRRMDDVLRDCWVYHPGIVLQLAAWQEWWWEVYAPSVALDKEELAGGTQSGYQAIAWWQSLEQAQARLAAEFRGCQAGSCWRKTRRPSPNGRVTGTPDRLADAHLDGYFPRWSAE